MKKLLSVLLVICLMLVFALPTLAAGVDDGTVSVVNKNGEKFFGTEIDQGLTKYVAANGSGESFYDANGDKEMDVCDLVAVATRQLDLDQSGSYTANDTATLRLILIGGNN